jgi:hypothetical protein
MRQNDQGRLARSGHPGVVCGEAANEYWPVWQNRDFGHGNASSFFPCSHQDTRFFRTSSIGCHRANRPVHRILIIPEASRFDKLNRDAGSRAVNISVAEKRAVRKPGLDRRFWAEAV